MDITIEGQTLPGVQRVLTLLRDFNTYSVENEHDAPFDELQLEGAIACITAMFEHAAEHHVPSALVRRHNVTVDCSLEDPLNDLKDLLLHEGMIPDVEHGKIYPSVLTAVEAQGVDPKEVDDAVTKFDYKRKQWCLPEDVRDFLINRSKYAEMVPA